MPDFTTLGHILTFPGQVKQKCCFFGRSSFLQITFELTKIEKKKHETPSYSSRQEASKHMHFDLEIDPKGQRENLTLG